jgi:phosphoribosylglycinamide formyltransferase-1
LPVNLIVDFAAGRFGETAAARAREAAAARGYELVCFERADDRLAAWIDWQFAPSWWSAEAQAGNVWQALDARGEIAGFAAFDVRGLRFPWLRGYERDVGIGVFGPYGVAPEHRKTGLGEALLDVALSSLRMQGYTRALIPAVGYDRLITMYETRAGARVADTYRYDSPRRFRATILASGSGTNAQSVFDRVASGVLPLEVGAVVTNTTTAGVIARAERAGVGVRSIVWNRAAETRSAFDTRVTAAVAASQPELVLLLGWMHLLPPGFIDAFSEIMNVHPAFLPFDPQADEVIVPDGSIIPAFRGAHALRDALNARVHWSGASVHRVTAEIDRGAIIVRTPLRLDTIPTHEVAERLRPIEHAAVAAAIRRWCFERF